jgi:hypothetical protein
VLCTLAACGARRGRTRARENNVDGIHINHRELTSSVRDQKGSLPSSTPKTITINGIRVRSPVGRACGSTTPVVLNVILCRYSFRMWATRGELTRPPGIPIYHNKLFIARRCASLHAYLRFCNTEPIKIRTLQNENVGLFSE